MLRLSDLKFIVVALVSEFEGIVVITSILLHQYPSLDHALERHRQKRKGILLEYSDLVAMPFLRIDFKNADPSNRRSIVDYGVDARNSPQPTENFGLVKVSA